MSELAHRSEYGSTEPDDRARDRGWTETALHGLIGGLVGALLAVVPLGTVLGGGVAGYLQGGTTRDGAVVGALAGLIAAVPQAVAAVVVLSADVALPGPAVPMGVLLGAVAVYLALYVVGAGAVGGVLGGRVQRD